MAGDEGGGHGERPGRDDRAGPDAGEGGDARDDGVEVLLNELRRRGQRVTTGRRAIAEVVVAASDLSAEEIVGRVQQHQPDVHPSTVYRTLETLEEAGLVRHVHLGHGPARWQLADNPSHHLVCEVCGAVQLVPRSLFDELRNRVAAEYDFAIAFHHFATIGRCAHCQEQP